MSSDDFADLDPGESDGSRDAADADAGRSGGVRARLARLFSPRYLLLALVVSVVGLWVGGLVPLIGGITRFVGLAVATFCVGVAGARRAYVEIAVAAAAATVVSVLGGFLTSGFLPVAFDFLARHGVAFAVGATALGLVVGVVGYYFGRDLRAGFTRSL